MRLPGGSGSMNSPKIARPGSRSCFRRSIGAAMEVASGPERRTTPSPPRPGGVAIATMVSSRGKDFSALALVLAGVLAFQTREAVLQHLVNLIDLGVQVRDFHFTLQVDTVIQIALHTIFGPLAILAHHDDRSLNCRQHGE